MSMPCAAKRRTASSAMLRVSSRRVVEHLDFEQVARVVDAADRLDQPVGDVHLVVERQLDRDDRQRVERRAGLRLLVPVAHVEIHEVVPVPAVDRENDQDEEICGEGEAFQRASCSTGTITYITVGSAMTSNKRARRNLLDRVARGEVDDRHGHRAAARDAARPAVRGSGVRARRSSSRRPPGIPRSRPRPRQNTCPDCRHRRRHRRARLYAAGDARQRGGLRRRARRGARRNVLRRCSHHHVSSAGRHARARARSSSPRRARPTSRSPKKRRGRRS